MLLVINPYYLDIHDYLSVNMKVLRLSNLSNPNILLHYDEYNGHNKNISVLDNFYQLLLLVLPFCLCLF